MIPFADKTVVLDPGYFVSLHSNDIGAYCDDLLPNQKKILDNTSAYIIGSRSKLRISEIEILPNDIDLRVIFIMTKRSGDIVNEVIILEKFRQYFPLVMNTINELLHVDVITKVSHHPRRSSKIVFTYMSGKTGTYPADELYMILSRVVVFNEIIPSIWNQIEVLYVGKSLGLKTKSNVFLRTRQHTVLQSILADMNENDSTSDIIIFACQPRLSCITLNSNTSSVIEENMNGNYLLNEYISNSDIVGIAEVCFIQYFQPKYNKNLKGHVAPDAKYLKVFKDNEFTQIFMGIDLVDSKTFFKSDTILASDFHKFTLQIHFDKDLVIFHHYIQAFASSNK